jgi:hypothetical protein
MATPRPGEQKTQQRPAEQPPCRRRGQPQGQAARCRSTMRNRAGRRAGAPYRTHTAHHNDVNSSAPSSRPDQLLHPSDSRHERVYGNPKQCSRTVMCYRQRLSETAGAQRPPPALQVSARSEASGTRRKRVHVRRADRNAYGCWSTSETSWLRSAGNLRVILLRSGLLGVVSGA